MLRHAAACRLRCSLLAEFPPPRSVPVQQRTGHGPGGTRRSPRPRCPCCPQEPTMEVTPSRDGAPNSPKSKRGSRPQPRPRASFFAPFLLAELAACHTRLNLNCLSFKTKANRSFVIHQPPEQSCLLLPSSRSTGAQRSFFCC